MSISSGDLFIALSRASRRVWNIQRRLLFNIPTLIQMGAIDESKARHWTEKLREISASLFVDGLVFTMGPTISVIGPQGVGKSSVVNDLLNLDGEARLPSNPEEGERLPILILHREKATHFGVESQPQAIYINLDKRSESIPRFISYEEARNRALEEQEFAGWIIWFADDDFLKKYNVFLSPGIKSSRLWLNEVLRAMLKSASVNLVVLDSRSLENVDYRRILDRYYHASTDLYMVLTFVDFIEDRKGFLKYAEGRMELEPDRLFLYPDEENLGSLREVLLKSTKVNDVDAFLVSEHLINAQILRGEIEGVLNELNEEDFNRFLSGPIQRKFDESIRKILKEFRGIMKMTFGKIFTNMLRTLNEIVDSHIRSKNIFGSKKLEMDALSNKIIEEFENIIKTDFNNKLFKLLEDYVDKYIESLFSRVDKELLRLEWPDYIMHVHLIKKPWEKLDKLASKSEPSLINLEDIYKKIENLKESDSELRVLLDYSKVEYESPVDKAINKNTIFFFYKFQTELKNIVEMFIFEDVKPSIVREKLNSLLFEAIEEFQEKVAESLENELGTIRDKFLHEYRNILGFKGVVAGHVLLQEALSKARIEIDNAINLMTSIL